MAITLDRTQKRMASMQWLRENYSHIWYNPRLSVTQKAGFLAACCDSRRCYLATLSLEDRLNELEIDLLKDAMS